jgi:ABC-type nitrate/sulfonate/bicarbonate transport system substrate-binding protein
VLTSRAMGRARTWKLLAVVATGLLLVSALLLARRWAMGPRHHLTVAAVRQPATSLFFVARASGCFDRERLVVEERTFELGRDALVLLLSGDADVAIAYETPTLRAYARDDRLRVLTTLHTSTRNTRVVARRDRGIESVRDLRGKRLAAAKGTNAEFFVDHLLTLGGVARDEVTIVDVAPEVAPAALEAGEVDAVALSDPHAARARDALGGRAVEILTDLYTEFSMASARAETIATRREALRALVHGLACAERFLLDHPEEAYAAIRPRFADLTDGDLRAALGRVTRGVGLDEVFSAVLRREAEWMRANGGFAAPDLSSLLDSSLLDEVEPEAVNLLSRR